MDIQETLSATDDPELSRKAAEGLFIMEVFPALALPGFFGDFSARLSGPRYNPARRKTFKIDDWRRVASFLSDLGGQHQIEGLAGWCWDHSEKAVPSKADQDKLDAVICAVIGYHWLQAPRNQSIMIGNSETGYIVAPALSGVHERLAIAAKKHGVAVDGTSL